MDPRRHDSRLQLGDSYWTTFFPAVLALGFGMAITVAPLTTTVMNSVDTHAAGVASGVNNAVSRVAALLAVAVFGIVMSQAFNRTVDRRLAEMVASTQAVEAIEAQRDKLAAIEIPSNLEPHVREALQRAIAESFVDGFRWVMVLGATLAFASAAVAWTMIEPGTARSSGRP